MARPKKEDLKNLAPTRDRILSVAIDLFSREGFTGTSVRTIARKVGLNEASMYNHFPSKEAILKAALDCMEENLIRSGLDISEAEITEGMSLEELLLKDSRRFFSQAAGAESMKVWRILIMEQYRNPAARKTLENLVLGAPRRYLTALLTAWQEQGIVAAEADTEAAAEALASVFFEFSFVSNLRAAWNEADPADLERLRSQVRFITRALT